LIGNDIVDLRDPDTRPSARTAAFDARVFTRAERERIDASMDSVRERWLAWSAKEAAYKLARQYDSGTIFVPRRFEVEFSAKPPAPGAGPRRSQGRSQGWVRFDALSLLCDWVCVDGFIHALCRLPSERVPDCVGFERLVDPGASPEDLARGVRRLALRAIGRGLEVDETKLEIRKRERIPSVWFEGRPLAADLSLSHHGTAMAFACRLPSRLDALVSTSQGGGRPLDGDSRVGVPL
jgi:hypothetical protein